MYYILLNMPAHHIPTNIVTRHTQAPSPSKISSVAKLQNYIQELLGSTHHTFLQGSYRNDTAIADINDVDIVAVRLDTYSGVYSQTPTNQSILWEQIFSEIEEILKAQKLYSWQVTRGDKCIKLSGAFKADVVPAVKITNDHLDDPISIYSFGDLNERINYPRIHYRNGVEKNKITNQNYKHLVRLFKNWSVNHFGLENDVVSSHKIEALVYGTENRHFLNDHASSFILVADSILNRLNSYPTSILSVCGQENILSNWDIGARNKFIQSLDKSLLDSIAAYKSPTMNFAETKWRSAFNM